MTTNLTIVMYHYVRDLERSRFPMIKGRRISEFKTQLDYIAAHYNVVSADQVIGAVRGLETLPPDALWLTFDDGYIDHYTNVLPHLYERGWQGTFFPPSKAITAGELLDVNRIQFVLASVSSPNLIVDAIRSFLNEHSHRRGVSCFDEYWKAYAHPDRYDSADVIFAKRLLQHALPAAVRTELADALFSRFVTKDHRAFAAELYMSPDQLRTMIGIGQYVGSHGARHDWLDKLSPVQQAQDIDASLEFLRSLGAPADNWIMCYPYGAYNDTLLDVLQLRGCACAVTTKVAIADFAVDKALELPRMDTNDLPFC